MRDVVILDYNCAEFSSYDPRTSTWGFYLATASLPNMSTDNMYQDNLTKSNQELTADEGQEADEGRASGLHRSGAFDDRRQRSFLILGKQRTAAPSIILLFGVSTGSIHAQDRAAAPDNYDRQDFSGFHILED